MYDCSTDSYEENVRKVKEMADIAHSYGATIEGELGHVGDNEGSAEGSDHLADPSAFFTDPKLAKDFVDKTGVDALAVAIGTAHGNYPKGYVPVLDFQRLAELKAALKMPLVLHGGSGSGEENIRKAVAGGINKINVCTDAFHAATDAIKAKWEEDPNADYLTIMMTAEKAAKEFVRSYIRLIGSNDRYTFEAADNGSNE
jgi:fructose-bisphosphate aldolase class II